MQPETKTGRKGARGERLDLPKEKEKKKLGGAAQKGGSSIWGCDASHTSASKQRNKGAFISI